MADVYTKDTTIQIKTYNRNSSSDEEYTWSESLDTKMASQKAVKTYVDDVCLLPSEDYDTLTLGASNTTYTAPANGWFVLKHGQNTGYISMKKDDTNFEVLNTCGTPSGTYPTLIFPANKGDVVRITYSGTKGSLYFYYSKGGK